MIRPGVVEIAWVNGEGLWDGEGDAIEPVLLLRVDGGETLLFPAADWSALRERIDRAGDRFKLRGAVAAELLDLDHGGGV